jgi:hypothetical protein
MYIHMNLIYYNFLFFVIQALEMLFIPRIETIVFFIKNILITFKPLKNSVLLLKQGFIVSSLFEIKYILLLKNKMKTDKNRIK